MTSKDYNLLAATLGQIYYSKRTLKAREPVRDIFNSLAAALARQNPRFNKDKFFRAILKEYRSYPL